MWVLSKPKTGMDSTDITGLTRSAQRGDLDAFNRLVLVYQDGVYNLACRVLGDEAAAEQAAQAAFQRAYRELWQYGKADGLTSWRAWLFRWVIQACAHAWTQICRQKRLASSFISTPEAQFDLMKLPLDLRFVLALIDLEGLNYEEAGTALGVTTAEITSRLAEARTQLLNQSPVVVPG
jgi:RNA polymerase sigma-70 factor (ECF subfamily)